MTILRHAKVRITVTLTVAFAASTLGGLLVQGERTDQASASAQRGAWSSADPLKDAEPTTGQSVRLRDGRIFRIGESSADQSLFASIFEPAQGPRGAWKPAAIPAGFDGTKLGDVVLLSRSRFDCGQGCVLVRAETGSTPWIIFSEKEGWKLGPNDVAQPDPATLSRATVTALGTEEPLCGIHCGKVLLVSGTHTSGAGVSGIDQTRAQIYDPVSNLWAPSDSPNAPRVDSAAVLMQGPICGARCENIFLIGGGGVCFPHSFVCAHSGVTAEFFNPLSGTFQPAPPPQFPHYAGHSATVMRDGRVLVGDTPEMYFYVGDEDSHSEIFDPSANGGAGGWVEIRNECWVCTTGHSTTALPNGMVLAVGIRNDGDPATADEEIGAQLFDGSAWVDIQPPAEAGNLHSQDLLYGSWDECGRHCGKVLVAGGTVPDSEQNLSRPKYATELFAPAPVIERLEPDKGSSKGGTPFVVTGTGLASAAAHGAAFSGGPPFACGEGSSARCFPDPDDPDSRMHVIAPRHPEGPADFSVTTDGGGSNSLPFIFEPPLPSLQGVSPRCGPVGEEFPITLGGEHLDVVDTVLLGGVNRPGTANVSGTEMTVLVPPQSSPKELGVHVVSRGRNSNSVSLTVPCPPVPSVVAGPPPPGVGSAAGGGGVSSAPPNVNARVSAPLPGPGAGSSSAPQTPVPPTGAFSSGSSAPVFQPNLAEQVLGAQPVAQTQLQPSQQLSPDPLTGLATSVSGNSEPRPATRHAMVARKQAASLGVVLMWGTLLTGAILCGIRARKDEALVAHPALGAPAI